MGVGGGGKMFEMFKSKHRTFQTKTHSRTKQLNDGYRFDVPKNEERLTNTCLRS